MLRKLILLLCLALGPATWATHFSGGEIYWDCLGNNQYRITLMVYRDCAGIAVDPSVTLQLSSPCGNTTLVVSTPGGVEVSQLCGAQLPNSTCNGGTLPGMQQYTYTGLITLPPCNSWTISYTNIYRNNAIMNLQNPGTQRTYVRAVLNNAAVACNDSPMFTNNAIPYVCLGYPISYSFGAYDPEGDSLSYVLINAMGINGAAIPYVVPNTGANPIPGLTLNPATGLVNFTLNTQGNWVVVVQVNHWVNGVLAGSVMRDMQFVAYPCSNDPPDPTTGLVTGLNGTATQIGPREIRLCESGSFCYDMVISDPNAANVLTAFSNVQQNLPGSTFSFTGTNPITCHVCWTALPNTSGFFPFIVNVNDGACPISAFQTYVYSVTVVSGLYGNMITTGENCQGTADGTAAVSVTAGTGPYTYLWNTGATTPTITAGPGNYSVLMSDANGCISPLLTGTIGTQGLPNQANAGVDFTGCVGVYPIPLNGSVTNATGGVWSGGGGTFNGTWPNVTYAPNATEISNGTVTLTLTTTGNTTCPSASDQVTINLVNSFANTTISSTNALCNGGNGGTATVSPATPGFTYAWNTSPVQTTPTATGLAAGNYSVTVTDGNNCSTTLSTFVSQPSATIIASLTATNESCAGFANGTATAAASGGTGPYTYTWSNGATGSSITAGAGQYTVSVTNANNCAPVTGTITIAAGAQPNQANAGPDLAGCVGSFPITLNGSVTNATGGTWSGGSGSYSGTWPNVSYTPGATDLQNNGVTLTLSTTGNTGCPGANDQVFINLPNSFANATISHTNATCFGGSNGTATFSPNNPSFTYLWTDPAGQTTATATGLAAGPISVTATDAFGCSIALSVTIGPVSAVAITNLVATDESCAGNGNGTATVTASGGTAPFAYTWSNGATGPSITAGAGTYTVSVTDANNCTPATGSITINATAQPNQANAGPDVAGCIGSFPIALNGSVTNATGGTWSGGAGTFTGTWPNVSYAPTALEIQNNGVTLTLTSSGNTNCPNASDQVFINLPNSFANASITNTDATCFGGSNGTATFSPNNPSFTYLWSGPAAQTTATATGLSAGTYSVTATDAFGCTVTLSVSIGPVAAVSITSLTATDETCAGNGNGTATAAATGGTAPYTYTWSNGGTGSSITAGAGTYSVSVTDANNCTPAAGSITINALAQPNQANAGPDQVGCVGSFPIALNGTVTNATGGVWSGGAGSFSGTWPNVSYTPSSADLASNGTTLTLTSTGNTNCPNATDQVFINLPNSFANTTITSTNALCNAGTSGTASISPGAAGFSYAWNTTPSQSGATATGLAAGNYSVTITDSYNCQTLLSTTVGQPTAINLASLTATNETCAGMANGSATASASGGTAPYSYTWSTNATGPSITAGAGSYTVSITDANGCAPATGSITINATGQPNQANAGPDLVGCLNSLPVTLQGSVTNATSGVWSGGAGNMIGSGPNSQYMPSNAEIVAGGVTLTLTTTGNSSCPPASDQVLITLSNSFLNPALTPTHISCFGAANGSLAYSPALAGNTYLWNDPTAQTTPTATNLAPGTWGVTVTDALGCSTNVFSTITQPATLTIVSLNTTPVSCNGGNNGTANAQVSGGTTPYSISWVSGQTGATIVALPAGAVSVHVTDANGCTASDDGMVTQPPAIIVAAQVPDTVCINTPMTLSAQASGGTGNLSYQWGALGSGNPLTVTLSNSQNVQLTVSDQNGCVTPATVFPVTVLNLNAANLTAYGDTTICPGGTPATVGAALAGYSGPYTLTWPELNTTGPGPFTVPFNADQDLHVTITDQCGNTLTRTIALRVQTPPAINLPPIAAQGCAPLTVNFPDLQLGAGISYLWTLGNGSTSTAAMPVVTYTAGSYAVSLTVSTALGCISTSPSQGIIHSWQPPTAGFTANTWNTSAADANIVFTDQSIGSIVNWSWLFGDGGTSNNINPTHHYTDVGAFGVSLTVTDMHGCTSTADGTVTITPIHDVVIPNAFTPNPNGGSGGAFDPNDLNNDVFYAFVRFVKDFRMRIFNRWGELIFESDDVRQGWDGYYRGQLSPQDVYVVQTWIRFVDNKEVQKLTDLTLFR